MQPAQRQSLFFFALSCAVAIAIMCLFFLSVKKEISENSLTFDEPSYLLSGIRYLENKDFSINTTHPPLMKFLYALPIWSAKGEKEKLSGPLAKISESRNDFKMKRFGAPASDLFLRRPDLIEQSRTTALIFGVVLLSFIFLWSYQIYGPLGALLSLSIGAFFPAFLAHAGIAALDLPLTCFFFVSVYFFSKENRLCLFLGGLAFLAAVGTKISGLLLILILFIALALGPSANRRKQIRSSFLVCAGLSLIVIIYLNLLYLGANFGVPIKNFIAAGELSKTFWGWLGWLPIPLPGNLVEGLLRLQTRVMTGTDVLLLGKYRESSEWYAYALILLLKLPIGFFLVGLASLFSLKDRSWDNEERWLVIPAVTYPLAFLLLFKMNFGLRYLLPAFPFIIVFMGRGGCLLPSKERYFAPVLALIGVSWQIWSVNSFGGNFLTYFNPLEKYQPRPGALFCDSDLDWGQNFIRLKKFLEERNVKEVSFWRDDFYVLGNGIDPKAYGIRYKVIDDFRASIPAYLVLSACTRNRVWDLLDRDQKEHGRALFNGALWIGSRLKMPGRG